MGTYSIRKWTAQEIEKFCRVWNSSDSHREVGRKLKMGASKASQLAVVLRQAGHDVKRMR